MKSDRNVEFTVANSTSAERKGDTLHFLVSKQRKVSMKIVQCEFACDVLDDNDDIIIIIIIIIFTVTVLVNYDYTYLSIHIPGV